MDWAWIAWVTLRLTQQNIERIKEALVTFVQQNPGLSVIIFMAVASVIVAWIIKHARSLEKSRGK